MANQALLFAAISFCVCFSGISFFGFKYLSARERARQKERLERESLALYETIEKQNRDIDARRADLNRAKDAHEHQKAVDRASIKKLAEEKALGFPWLAKAYAEYFELKDERKALALETKKPPAIKAAEALREIKRDKRLLEQKFRVLKHLLEYYNTLFPWLVEFQGEDLDDVIRQGASENQNESKTVGHNADPASHWLTEEEYRALPRQERFQKALDRYCSRKKTSLEIGREYERFVGYLYERDDYRVSYTGAIRGFEDYGRDLICKKGQTTEIVQCKCWSKQKIIRLLSRICG